MTREEIFHKITAERQYQDAKWGVENDKNNTPNDWIAYITKYAGNASSLPFSEAHFRMQMIKVAALAIAALEQETYAPIKFQEALLG